jgi:hypothetical protein
MSPSHPSYPSSAYIKSDASALVSHYFPPNCIRAQPEDRPEWVWRGHYADSQNCRDSLAANLLASVLRRFTSIHNCRQQ